MWCNGLEIWSVGGSVKCISHRTTSNSQLTSESISLTGSEPPLSVRSRLSGGGAARWPGRAFLRLNEQSVAWTKRSFQTNKQSVCRTDCAFPSEERLAWRTGRSFHSNDQSD